MKASPIRLDTNDKNLLNSSIPNETVCSRLALLYSMFSDQIRLKIIISLLIKEMCVNDLAEILNTNQTTISHQLKILRNCGVVTCNRQNKFIFYKINNSYINDIMINGVDYILNKAS